MSEHNKHPMSSDEMLVAFLDGQLPMHEQQAMAALLEENEELAHRLAHLSAGQAPFRDAFDLLLDKAPTHRMAENFMRAAGKAAPETPRYSRRRLIAAAVALVAVGAAAGRGLDANIRQPETNEIWRAAVANYMALYSTDTLANLARDQEMLERQLATAGAMLHLPLRWNDVNTPGLELQRTQMLQFDGYPLGQLAFLDSNRQPLALCIIADSAEVAEPRAEQRQGMNVIYWSNTTHSFLVIGHLPPDAMEALANRLRDTLKV